MLFPASQHRVTLPALHQLRMFCSHWASSRYTGKPVAIRSQPTTSCGSQQIRLSPAIPLTDMLPSPKKDLAAHPNLWWKRVHCHLPTVIRKRLSISQVSFSHLCVCRKAQPSLGSQHSKNSPFMQVNYLQL